MTTTEEFIRPRAEAGPKFPDFARNPGPLSRPWLDAEYDAWLARQDRRNLRLIAAAGLALGLAIAGGLTFAWQADRWLTDWHYSLDGAPYALLEDAE